MILEFGWAKNGHDTKFGTFLSLALYGIYMFAVYIYYYIIYFCQETCSLASNPTLTAANDDYSCKASTGRGEVSAGCIGKCRRRVQSRLGMRLQARDCQRCERYAASVEHSAQLQAQTRWGIQLRGQFWDLSMNQDENSTSQIRHPSFKNEMQTKRTDHTRCAQDF